MLIYSLRNRAVIMLSGRFSAVQTSSCAFDWKGEDNSQWAAGKNLATCVHTMQNQWVYFKFINIWTFNLHSLSIVCSQNQWPQLPERAQLACGISPIKELLSYVCLCECTCKVEKEERILTGVRESKHNERTHVWPAAFQWHAKVGFSHGKKSRLMGGSLIPD